MTRVDLKDEIIDALELNLETRMLIAAVEFCNLHGLWMEKA